MVAIVQDNDPHFSNAWLREVSSRADLIHNELLARIVASQVIVREIDVNDPATVSPANELDAYLIGSAPVGDWAGLSGKLAFWLNGWKFIPVVSGMRVMVLNNRQGKSGESGHVMDFWISGWAAHGSTQDLVAVDTGGGNWEAPWNIKYGETARILLDQGTITISAPVNFRYGRAHRLIVKQDVIGGNALALKAAEWLVPGGGVVEQPTQTANAETVYEFVRAGAGHIGPLLLSVTHNLLPT